MKPKGSIAGTVAVGGTIAFIVVVELSPRPSPPILHLNFLTGLKPEIDSIDEFGWLAEGDYAGYEIDGHSNRDGPSILRRMRTYKFRGDYDAFEKVARQELAALGGKEDSELVSLIERAKEKVAAEGKDDRSMDMAEYFKGEEWMVSMRRSPHGPSGIEDPTTPFVNVMVMTYCNESFAGCAKRVFRKIGVPTGPPDQTP